jgi:hypothetical protein
MCAYKNKKDVMNINKGKALILLTAVAVAAVMGGVILNAYSANNANQSSNSSTEWINWATMPGTCGWSNRGMRGHGGFGFIEVSDEFKQNVINIAENDTDVQTLLNEGYNITGVRPIIKSIVEGDGTVTTKATSAIVILEKDTTSHASVWVDLEQAKVTQIVILTRTVIEKP